METICSGCFATEAQRQKRKLETGDRRPENKIGNTESGKTACPQMAQMNADEKNCGNLRNLRIQMLLCKDANQSFRSGGLGGWRQARRLSYNEKPRFADGSGHEFFPGAALLRRRNGRAAARPYQEWKPPLR
jgi:hypothetical protein